MGIFLGMYPVLAGRSRNNDCWSRHVEFGVSFMDYSFYFDEAFPIYDWLNWIMLLVKLSFDILGLYNLIDSCKAQVDFSVWTIWLYMFRIGRA
jgi:hypothetical protein